MESENFTIYNLTGPAMPMNPYDPFYQKVWTYADILSTFSDQFLGQILRFSLLFLALEITCLWFIRDWREVTWGKFSTANKQEKEMKIFTTMVYVCMIPAFFMPIILLLFRYGVNI